MHTQEQTSQRQEGSTPRSGANWNDRSLGKSWQHQFFYVAIRLGGRRLAYFFLYFIALYYVLCSRGARQRCSPYLRRRFPHAGRFHRLWYSYKLILNFGKVLIDRAVVGIMGPDAFHVTLYGREQLLALRDEGHGLIMMGAHVGCWQVAMSALDFMQCPVNMLMRREDGDVDRHYYEHAGIECPYRVIDPTEYLGGTLQMLGALKQGEVVCVMGDRMLGSDRSSVGVEFLGGSVELPYSAYKIAAATGAPVVVFFTRKDGPASYSLHVADVIRVPQVKGREAQTFAPYARRFSEALEQYSTEHPFQFFNFFDMWRT
ncbi:MAG: lysophospholipid acyltransferase family protein [Geobacteraceae bacterium]|nr:lysophospholipid acyltransferase family protein [Geobacteraceae bacterium]